MDNNELVQIYVESSFEYESSQDKFNLYLGEIQNDIGSGNSFVEGTNHSIKNSPIGVNSKMIIGHSGISTQVKAVSQQGIKRKIAMTNIISKTKTWIRSLTAEYLTTYVEGLVACHFI